MLGPCCNHDLGVLIRLPAKPSGASTTTVQSVKHDARSVQSPEASKSVDAMIEAMGDHEFYCSNYACKEQPHIEGLLQSLADGLRGLELAITDKRELGDQCDTLEYAKRLMQRLTSSTNRRMHKGVPENHELPS